MLKIRSSEWWQNFVKLEPTEPEETIDISSKIGSGEAEQE